MEFAARQAFTSAAGQFRFKNTAVQDLAFRHFQSNYEQDPASGAIKNKATGQFFFKDSAGTLGTLGDLVQHLAQGELAPLFDVAAPQGPAAGIGHLANGQGAPADPQFWRPSEAWLDDSRNIAAIVATGQKDRLIRMGTIDKGAIDAYFQKRA
jgi:hypothetical protein